jgi:hypothetical protein
MTREQKLREALIYAQDLGVRIERGPSFDWTCADPDGGFPISSGDLPSACNLYGALLLLLKSEKQTCEQYLGVNTSWMYRLHIGFNNLYQLEVIRTTKKKGSGKVKVIRTPDKISSLGVRLAKEFCPY